MPPQFDAHREQLDGLRAIAVMAVLFTHFWSPDSITGHWGVRLFFVLSGFLITKILLENSASPDLDGRSRMALIKAFYIRRALRIFPAYYLALAVAAVLLDEITGMLPSLPWHIFYASNIYFAFNNDWDPWPLAHLWSLAVEEQFYLIWPALTLSLARGKLPMLFGVMIVLSMVFQETVHRHQPNGIGSDILMPTAISALAAGALLAHAVVSASTGAMDLIRVRRRLAYAALAAIGIVVSPLADSLPVAVAEMLSVLPMAYLVIAAYLGLPGFPGAALACRPSAYLGRISYGIYLWHFIVLALMFKYVPAFATRLPDPGPARFLVAGATTVIVASLSWYLVESPINRLKRRYPYRGAAARTPSVAPIR